MIKKSIINLSLVSLLALSTQAQESKLKVSQTTNSDKSVRLNFEKTDPGTQTLVLNFREINNSSGSLIQSFTVNGYGGSFLTLNPTNKGQGIGLSYSYRYIRGKFNPKFDNAFVYLLPYENDVQVKVGESSFLGATYFGNTTPEDWKVYRFYTKDEENVTAARKGVVVEIVDTFESDNAGVAYTSKTNHLIIEHADGTLATYKGLKKGSFKVELGQTVFPGTILARNCKYGSNDRYNISLMVSYLKSKDLEVNSSQNVKNAKSYYGFITPKFFTSENPNVVLEADAFYTVAQSKDIVQREFTKKELKNIK